MDVSEEPESAHEAAQRRLAFGSDVTASSALVEDGSALQESGCRTSASNKRMLMATSAVR